MGQLVKDKVILVTGSTTGIGESVARRIVAEGGQVMIHGRNADRAAALAEELGETAAFSLGDLQDPAAPGRLVEAALSSGSAVWMRSSTTRRFLRAPISTMRPPTSLTGKSP